MHAGHSLGAHIAGSAGRNLNAMTSQLIPRITGLDPANPCTVSFFLKFISPVFINVQV